MKPHAPISKALVLAFAVTATGCLPVRSSVYVPDVPGGKVLYSTCAFNSHVPIGVSIGIQAIDVTVSLSQHDGRHFVEVRFDIPEGESLQLTEPIAKLETNTTAKATEARFPSVSLVDSPIVNSFSTLPSVQAAQLPPTAVLVGQNVSAGNISFKKHFWLATYVDVGNAEDLWITLGEPLVNGVSRPIPRLHFHRQSMTIMALFNC